MNSRAAAALVIVVAFAGVPQTANALVIAGNLYEDSAQIACNPGFTCQLDFAVLPSVTSGKLVRVTEVGCEFVASLPVRRVRLILSDNGASYRRDHYLPAPNQDGQFTYWTPVDFTITGGPPRRLSMIIGTPNTSNILNMYCTVIGTISTP